MAEGPNVGKGDEEGKEDKADSEKEEGEWEPPAEEVCTSCQASLCKRCNPVGLEQQDATFQRQCPRHESHACFGVPILATL